MTVRVEGEQQGRGANDSQAELRARLEAWRQKKAQEKLSGVRPTENKSAGDGGTRNPASSRPHVLQVRDQNKENCVSKVPLSSAATKEPVRKSFQQNITRETGGCWAEQPPPPSNRRQQSAARHEPSTKSSQVQGTQESGPCVEQLRAQVASLRKQADSQGRANEALRSRVQQLEVEKGILQQDLDAMTTKLHTAVLERSRAAELSEKLQEINAIQTQQTEHFLKAREKQVRKTYNHNMRALATVAAKETTKLLQLAVGRQHIEHQADLEKFQLEAENELGLMRAEYERALKACAERRSKE